MDDDERRKHISTVTLELEVAHDHEPGHITDLARADLIHALEDRGCIVWGSSTWWRDPNEPNRRAGGLWVALAVWVGRVDGRARWCPASQAARRAGLGLQAFEQ